MATRGDIWDDPSMHPRRLTPRRPGHGQTFSSAGYNILAPSEPQSPHAQTVQPGHGDVITGSDATQFTGVARPHSSAPEVAAAGQRNYSRPEGRARTFGLGVNNGNILLPGDDFTRGVTPEQIEYADSLVGKPTSPGKRPPTSPSKARPAAGGPVPTSPRAAPEAEAQSPAAEPAAEATGAVTEQAVDNVVEELVSTVIEEVASNPGTPRGGDEPADAPALPQEVETAPAESHPLEGVEAVASPITGTSAETPRRHPGSVGGTPERPRTATRVKQPPGGVSSFTLG